MIQVISAAINPVNFKAPEADLFGRTMGMGRVARPGFDFCDLVIALKMALRQGSLGEVLIVSRSEFAILPGGVGPGKAVATATAAGTAWQSLLPASRVVKEGTITLVPICIDRATPFSRLRAHFVQVATNPAIRDIGAVVGTKLLSLVPGSKQRTFHFVMQKASHDDYVQFGQWLAEGRLRAVVDTAFEFTNVPAAFRKLKDGHVKGKLIIHVAAD